MAPLPQPDLPEPAHPSVDSMLSRKFGKEVANYFSGSLTSTTPLAAMY
jgi:NAD+ diphosphatase